MTTKVFRFTLPDLGLPDINGVEVIKKIRCWSSIPIIVISARNEDRDKIEALDFGADDYLTKPFSVDELLARLRVTIRRIGFLSGFSNEENNCFINGDLKIDFMAAGVFVGDKEIHLTPMEFKLLALLAKNIGKVLSYKYITNEIWGNSWDNDVASLRVFMTNLRKKIEKEPNEPKYIQTHVGIGYRMIKT